MKVTLGQKLKKLRGDLSQSEVASAIGVSVSTISMYENDERIPRDELKVKLSNYYNCNIEELFYPKSTRNVNK